jgi:hypothetical protein
MLFRMRLLCWRPNWICSCLWTRPIWLPPRVAFFLTLETHVINAHIYLLLLTPLALSAEGHSHSDSNNHSLSSEGYSLDLSTQMSPPACPVRRRQLRTLWGSCLISLLKMLALLQQAGRPRERRRKRPADIYRGIIQSRCLLVPFPWGSAPPSALSPRPRRRLRSSSSAALASYVESPRQGGN